MWCGAVRCVAQVLAHAEAHFQLPGLASAPSAAVKLQYRRDNVAMERAMQRHAAVTKSAPPDDSASPSLPADMLVSVTCGAAREALAAGLVGPSVAALLQLADANVRSARQELRSQECYAVPADASQLTVLHDSQLNALLQAWAAVTAASSLHMALRQVSGSPPSSRCSIHPPSRLPSVLMLSSSLISRAVYRTAARIIIFAICP